jgi:hypothetical protein
MIILDEGKNTDHPKIEVGNFSGPLFIICNINPLDESED